MKQRNSTIELLRIIAMMGVVALHYLGEGGIVDSYSFPNFTWFFMQGVRSIAVPLVNVFVLITGYFMVTSRHFAYRKPVRLLAIVFYYGIVIYLVSSLVHGSAFSIQGFLHSVFPFFFGTAWFIKTYLILYLLSPFINKVLIALSIHGYRRLLVIQLLLFSVWYSFGLSSPVTDDGYGILNFLTLYMIGGYIRRFSGECKFLMRFSSFGAFSGYLICTAATGIASYFINPFGYAFITNVAGAAFLMLAFIKAKPRSSKVINTMAATAFDVFFVHSHIYALMGIEQVAGTVWMIPHLLFTVVCCYIAGFASGWIREWLFRFSIDKLLNHIPALNKDLIM